MYLDLQSIQTMAFIQMVCRPLNWPLWRSAYSSAFHWGRLGLLQTKGPSICSLHCFRASFDSGQTILSARKDGVDAYHHALCSAPFLHYIYIYIYSHFFVNVDVSYIYTHIYMYMHIRIPTYCKAVFLPVCTYIHIYIHVCMYIIYIYICIYTYTCTYTYMLTRTYTYMYALYAQGPFWKVF